MEKTALSRKLFCILITLSFGLSTLFVALAKCYTLLATNIAFMYTILPGLLNILNSIIQWSIFAIAYAIIIFIMYAEGPSAGKRFILAYGGSVIYKYLFNFLISWLTDRVALSDIFWQNLGYIGIYILIELTQLTIVILFVRAIMAAHHRFLKGQRHLAEDVLHTELDERAYTFPFKKLLTRRNVLQKSALYTGLTLSVFKIVSRIIYDISYGAPDSLTQVFWMIFYYIADIVVGLITTLFITYLFMMMDNFQQKLANNGQI